MSQSKQVVTVGLLAALVGGVTGILTTAFRAQAAVEGIATKIAQREAAAVRTDLQHQIDGVKADLDKHIATVDAERIRMFAFVVRQDGRDRYLVQAVAALCRATPRAACPAPTAMVTSGEHQPVADRDD